ncbi:MAG: hypothetical protein JRG86_08875 [Deltaproteobacteria bacterium]|jgi:hypothetical protein|nr:hypothetical protein [Deltaproteobacteria bacterium]MBW2498245.1 hypothetical protein [Deltaproteobacteria bacterium]
MIARNFVIALLAGLFALQAPLCEIACTSGVDAGEHGSARSDSHPATTQSAASHAMPCHEAPAPAAPSGEDRGAHDDCGCETLTPFVSSKNQSLSGLAFTPPPAKAAVELRWDRSESPRTFPPDRAHLVPPPDILLLHSILLI